MNYIHRELEGELKTLLARKEAIILIGPRQAGKTTLLLNLQKELEQRGKQVKYITFEDRSELSLFEDSVEEFKELYQHYDFLLIDEFHYAQEGGQKLKFLYDTTNVKLIVSGSSSLELTFQTGKYMVGRSLIMHLWPFSFPEYLKAKDESLFSLYEKRAVNFWDIDTPSLLGPASHQGLEKVFEDYLAYGGYPAVALEDEPENRKKLLENTLNNYLLRDIKSLLSLASDKELVLLARFLSAQIGNLVNYQELSGISGLNSKDMKDHLNILEETFIIKLIFPFFTNKTLELVKSPKVYFMDTGFRNLLMANFHLPEDIGALVENFACIRLLQQKFTFDSLNYWRTKSQAEVDFVLRRGQEILPIEVKYRSKPVMGKSLHSFLGKFSPKRALVLTKSYAAVKTVGQTKVIFMPVYYL